MRAFRSRAPRGGPAAREPPHGSSLPRAFGDTLRDAFVSGCPEGQNRRNGWRITDIEVAFVRAVSIEDDGESSDNPGTHNGGDEHGQR
jgi:hypothetical protein